MESVKPIDLLLLLQQLLLLPLPEVNDRCYRSYSSSSVCVRVWVFGAGEGPTKYAGRCAPGGGGPHEQTRAERDGPATSTRRHKGTVWQLPSMDCQVARHWTAGAIRLPPLGPNQLSAIRNLCHSVSDQWMYVTCTHACPPTQGQRLLVTRSPTNKLWTLASPAVLV